MESQRKFKTTGQLFVGKNFDIVDEENKIVKDKMNGEWYAVQGEHLKSCKCGKCGESQYNIVDNENNIYRCDVCDELCVIDNDGRKTISKEEMIEIQNNKSKKASTKVTATKTQKEQNVTQSHQTGCKCLTCGEKDSFKSIDKENNMFECETCEDWLVIDENGARYPTPEEVFETKLKLEKSKKMGKEVHKADLTAKDFAENRASLETEALLKSDVGHKALEQIQGIWHKVKFTLDKKEKEETERSK